MGVYRPTPRRPFQRRRWIGTAAAAVGTVWVSPANHSAMSTTPVLVFTTSAPGAGNMYFQIEVDKVNTFNGADYQLFDSSLSQVGWEYYNGSTWVAVPPAGVPNAYSGNDARYTVQTPLSSGTWYRRVRTGT